MQSVIQNTNVTLRKFTIWQRPEYMLELQIYDDFPVLHVNFYEWSHNIFLRALDEFFEIREMLAFFGIPDVYVAIPSTEPQAMKLAQMFGFEDFTLLEGDIVIMVSRGESLREAA